jgi:hypothetical protein
MRDYEENLFKQVFLPIKLLYKYYFDGGIDVSDEKENTNKIEL